MTDKERDNLLREIGNGVNDLKIGQAEFQVEVKSYMDCVAEMTKFEKLLYWLDHNYIFPKLMIAASVTIIILLIVVNYLTYLEILALAGS